MKLFYGLLSVLFSGAIYAQQITGCTDYQAINYNASATINDGACLYGDQAIQVQSFDLSTRLKESSGLSFFNGNMYTHNDDGLTQIYVIDTLTGALQDSVLIANVSNVDWEDLEVHDDWFYVGDFGNNVSGNRSNLRIFKWDSDAHNSGVFDIDTIRFSYENQTSFLPISANTTAFDCEAFIVFQDSLYLFSKRWNDQRTFLYAIPNVAGLHVAKLLDSLDTQGMVTGAHYDTASGRICLVGYTNLLQPYLYFLYDYEGRGFFGGNKRRIALNLPFHQVEAVSSTGNGHYYFSNEFAHISPLPAVQAKFHKVDLSALFLGAPLVDYSSLDLEADAAIKVYPNPTHSKLIIGESVQDYKIMDMWGREVMRGVTWSGEIDISHLKTGVYFLEISGKEKPIKWIKQ